MSKSALRHLPTLVGFLGCLWIIIGALELVGAFKTLSWPKAPGVITHSLVNDFIVTGEEGSVNQSVKAEIEYSFSVGGHSFTGREIRFGDPLVNPFVSNRGAAHEVNQRYGRQMPVQLHVFLLSFYP